MADAARLGVIGGSGLYELPGLVDKRWVGVETPWGAPSDEILLGRLGDVDMAFLPRHGRGHRIPPAELNHRANIAAFKQLGVQEVLSLSAVGSLRAELPPGTFVVVDQFIDRTSGRARSFFGSGLVAHVSMADPVCSRIGPVLAELLRGGGTPWAAGGTYVAIDGPQFSTRAESALYRSWNASVIGMTNLPEAQLAREAELCYAAVAMVTDFDCWHPDHDAVTVDAVVGVLLGNADRARALVAAWARRRESAGSVSSCACQHALDHAIITPPAARDPAMVERLRVIAGRVL
ncbi:MAG TPA: S-methyl-5'-thioadenosine phosphorylase [Rubrivivax sp.]